MRQVRLVMDHKEGDVQYYAGQTIVLPDESAAWLISAQAGLRMVDINPVDAPVEEVPVEEVPAEEVPAEDSVEFVDHE